MRWASLVGFVDRRNAAVGIVIIFALGAGIWIALGPLGVRLSTVLLAVAVIPWDLLLLMVLMDGVR